MAAAWAVRAALGELEGLAGRSSPHQIESAVPSFSHSCPPQPMSKSRLAAAVSTWALGIRRLKVVPSSRPLVTSSSNWCESLTCLTTANPMPTPCDRVL